MYKQESWPHKRGCRLSNQAHLGKKVLLMDAGVVVRWKVNVTFK